jgi:hydroxymethylpyrimidine pyrophosphatase-like HAD family hydrolase
MIKLIILDVDGVVLGSQKGINVPFPTTTVQDHILDLQNRGVVIALCTGKPSFAVKRMIQRVQLNNLHISDGGAVISNPIDGVVIRNINIPKQVVQQLLSQTVDRKALWQLYTMDSKYVQAGKFPRELQEDSELMPWVEVDDLLTIAQTESLTKLETIYSPEEEGYYRTLFKRYEDAITVQWTGVPTLLPNKLVIVTAKGVDKQTAVQELAKYHKIQLSEILAVGDTMMDWKFMQDCGYVATLSNASAEMQELVKSRGGFVGRDVDQDGLVDVLEYFKNLID